jgi:hypothetical protein
MNLNLQSGQMITKTEYEKFQDDWKFEQMEERGCKRIDGRDLGGYVYVWGMVWVGEREGRTWERR